MLFPELPTSFPWYEKLERQNRYAENVEKSCDYKLISPRDTLLPFQFYRTPGGGAQPTTWQVFEINSQNVAATLTSQLAKVLYVAKDGKDYFYFDGQTLGMNLQPGYYYSKLTFAGGGSFNSEMFHVPDDYFNANGDTATKYMKLVWYNKTDIKPIFYNDLVGGIPKFKNVLYLDSFVTSSEPEVEEEGEPDGNGELITLFQKAVINYRITAILPDFLKKAIVLMQMHDVIELTTAYGIRSGSLDKIEVSTTPEFNGGFATVEILWKDIVLVKKGCGENMV